MSSKTSKSWRQRRATCWGIVKTPWVLACTATIVAAIVLGITLGWEFRGQELSIQVDNTLGRRMLTTALTLVNVDTTAGLASFQWYIVDDSCVENAITAGNVVTDQSCPLVNIYMDSNLISSQTCSTPDTPPPTNNIPDQPVFQFNASAWYNEGNYASAPVFQTDIYLQPKGYTIESSPENYPWDKYTVAPWIFATANATGNKIGITIDPLSGVVVGFQAHVHTGDYTYSYDTTEVFISISRSTLVKLYVISIVASMWLVTLVLLAITVKGVVMGHGQRTEILLMPVTTLFAFTSLRGTMPGAPQSFGVVVDFVGTLPSFVFLAIAAVICLAPFLFDMDPEKPRGQRKGRAVRTDDSDDEFQAEGFTLPSGRPHSLRGNHYDPYSSKNAYDPYSVPRTSSQDSTYWASKGARVSPRDAAEDKIFDASEKETHQ